MKFVTLCTDFGEDDNYVALMKGVMLSINPKLNIVDVTHNIKSFDIKNAAFFIDSTVDYFPKETIHMVVVDPDVNTKTPIAIKTENFFLVGPDNGVFDIVLERYGVVCAVNLDNAKYHCPKISETFRGRDVFAPVVAWISKGVSIENLGSNVKYVPKLKINKPLIQEGILECEILHIDKFGNIVLHTSPEVLSKFDFKNVRNVMYKGDYHLCRFVQGYTKASDDQLLLLVGSTDRLELSLHAKSAKDYLGANVGDIIQLEV